MAELSLVDLIMDIKTRLDTSHMTFEEAYAGLEAIVFALESDKHPLEESTELFERGQALARYCARLLDEAELRVQQVSAAAE
jgi:exodeoxyribonuclease VII small subunit